MNKKILHTLVLAALLASVSAPAWAVSLWADNASLFTDRKASMIGDTVLVQIDEEFDDSDEGEVSSTKNTNENITGGVGILDFIRAFGFGSASSTSSNTTVERTKELSGNVSCLVTDVMPNGNLVIEGDRTLTSGAEKMKIRFSGVVRQMDIAHNNTVPSSRVANAEISVGGRGIVSRTQRPGLINQILQAIF